ncbi:MAG: discoidin domain-containing protein, partial [Gammaproteobacteria bacterium]|nr:discoidin domain-containing protein [Gammaproteobacteria bacterium]
CNNEPYAIKSAIDDGNFDSAYSPENVIDSDTSATSRWSNNGVNKALILDLGLSQKLRALTIKWFKGAERVANFSVETSLDNITWIDHCEQLRRPGKQPG